MATQPPPGRAHSSLPCMAKLEGDLRPLRPNHRTTFSSLRPPFGLPREQEWSRVLFRCAAKPLVQANDVQPPHGHKRQLSVREWHPDRPSRLPRPLERPVDLSPRHRPRKQPGATAGLLPSLKSSHPEVKSRPNGYPKKFPLALQDRAIFDVRGKAHAPASNKTLSYPMQL